MLGSASEVLSACSPTAFPFFPAENHFLRPVLGGRLRPHFTLTCSTYRRLAMLLTFLMGIYHTLERPGAVSLSMPL